MDYFTLKVVLYFFLSRSVSNSPELSKYFKKKNSFLLLQYSNIINIVEGWQCISLGLYFLIFLIINSKSISFKLTWDKMNQLLIAPGIAHGFAVLGDYARIHYKSSVYYGSTQQFGIHWASPELAHLWPTGEWVVSERDSTFQLLQDIEMNSIK